MADFKNNVDVLSFRNAFILAQERECRKLIGIVFTSGRNSTKLCEQPPVQPPTGTMKIYSVPLETLFLIPARNTAIEGVFEKGNSWRKPI